MPVSSRWVAGEGCLTRCRVLLLTDLDRTGLDWPGPAWTGPDWTGLDRTSKHGPSY